VLTIDEVSFIQPEALHLVDIQLRRLCGRPDIPFGGIALILAGDFWQKPPPSSISLAEMLAGADVQGMPRHKPIEAMSNCDRGLAIFRDARRTVLTQQMRAAEDTEFQEELLQLRNTAREDPVPISLLESLREVSDADVAEHPPWAFATIAVLSNYERHHLNRKQAEAFARAHSLPIVMWRLPLTGRAAELLDDLMLHDLYENEPGLWGVFVRGAPAMLTANIQPTKFLVNGACGYMHSLSFPDEAPEVLVTEASGLGFRRVVLEEPPLTVNFQFSLPDGDDGAGIETLVDGYVVVPIHRQEPSRRDPRHGVPLGLHEVRAEDIEVPQAPRGPVLRSN
jgi:hypothetical protein